MEEKEGKKVGVLEKLKAPFVKKGSHAGPAKGSGKKRAAIIAVVLVAVMGAGVFGRGFFTGEAQAAEYTEHIVTRGDVEVVISGSGTAEPNDQYDVIALVAGEILADTFEEGDTVEKGDLLYTIDSTEMENTLQRASISLERSQMSYQSEVDSYNGLNVKAPISGRISELYVSKNDSVQNGGTVAKIIDDSAMRVRVPFSVGDAEGLYVGQSGTVVVENTFEILTAHVTKIYSNQRSLDGNIQVTDVELELSNPGALRNGTYVTATIGGADSYEGGTLEGSIEKLVTADNSGTVEEIHIAEGQYVSSGELLMKLSNDSASDSLRSSALSLQDTQLSYNNSVKQLEDYQITATISGTVIEKTYKAGDTLDSSSSRTTLAVIADMSKITVEISVDELDIAQIEVGQEAEITVDALSDQVFTGYVERIGLNGTSAMGVTTYPVTVVINNPDGIWPGMNVTVDITVESASDVIRVPVSAVQRGNLVLVEKSFEQEEKQSLGRDDFGGGDGFGGEMPEGLDFDAVPEGFNPEGFSPEDPDTAGEDSSSAPQRQGGTIGSGMPAPGAGEIDQSNAPDGYKYVRVTTGINDDNYIEITWGLEEGVTILVPKTSNSTSSGGDMMMMTMPAGGGGMGGGAMPSGGPGGGMGGGPGR